MKQIKIRQKKCEDLKQTKSPLEEEQHVQDAGEAAASLCVSVPVLSLGCAEKWQQKEPVAALAQPQLGAGKSQGAIPSRKDDVGKWKQPTSMEKCLHRQPGPAGTNLSALQELHPEVPLPKGTECILARRVRFSTLSLPNTAVAQHTSMYMENYFLPRCSYLELNNCLQL